VRDWVVNCSDVGDGQEDRSCSISYLSSSWHYSSLVVVLCWVSHLRFVHVNHEEWLENLWLNLQVEPDSDLYY
jgi:hypothetical protein